MSIEENKLYHQMLKTKNGLKTLSLSSSLYLLNFLYICRYGGISKTGKLKQLLLQSMSSGKGGLGIRFMIHFYVKEFFIDLISDTKNDMMQEYESKNDDKIKDLLFKIYNNSIQDTLFEFLYTFYPYCISDFYDIKSTKDY